MTQQEITKFFTDSAVLFGSLGGLAGAIAMVWVIVTKPFTGKQKPTKIAKISQPTVIVGVSTQFEQYVPKYKPFGECTLSAKADRLADFFMSMVLSTAVPAFPIVVSKLLGSLTATISIQSLFIYLCLVAATAKHKWFRYLSLLGGVGTGVLYGMMEGTVAFVQQNQSLILEVLWYFAASMTFSNLFLAAEKHLKLGKPVFGGH